MKIRIQGRKKDEGNTREHLRSLVREVQQKERKKNDTVTSEKQMLL